MQSDSTLTVGISTAERNGQIVAHSAGASFSGADLKRLSPVRLAYVVTFYGHAATDEFSPDDATATIYAVDDPTAIEYARAKWIAPFQVTEKITTWREVADIEA